MVIKKKMKSQGAVKTKSVMRPEEQDGRISFAFHSILEIPIQYLPLTKNCYLARRRLTFVITNIGRLHDFQRQEVSYNVSILLAF